MNGFDGSLFGGLTANSKFLDYFNGSNDGVRLICSLRILPLTLRNKIWAGLVSSMYQIGGVCALPFVGPAIDTWGRRVGMFVSFAPIMFQSFLCALCSTQKNSFPNIRFPVPDYDADLPGTKDRCIDHHRRDDYLWYDQIQPNGRPVHGWPVLPGFRRLHCQFCRPNLCCRNLTSVLPRHHDCVLQHVLVYGFHPCSRVCAWCTSFAWDQVMADSSLAAIGVLVLDMLGGPLHSRKSALVICS